MLELQGALAGWDYSTGVGPAKSQGRDDRRSQGYRHRLAHAAGRVRRHHQPVRSRRLPAGQAALDAAQVHRTDVDRHSDIEFADFRVTKDLFQMPAGPLAVAFGVEHRKEKSFFDATDITGELGSLGIDPDSDSSGKRNVTALFAELSIPIVKNLDMTFAGALRQVQRLRQHRQPEGRRCAGSRRKQLLVRGSFNTGFRAPTLYDIYEPPSLTFTSDNYDDPLLCPGGVAVPGASAGVVCGQQVLQRMSGPAAIGQPPNSLSPRSRRRFTLGLRVRADLSPSRSASTSGRSRSRT